jgi:hypothetical protein
MISLSRFWERDRVRANRCAPPSPLILSLQKEGEEAIKEAATQSEKGFSR